MTTRRRLGGALVLVLVALAWFARVSPRDDQRAPWPRAEVALRGPDTARAAEPAASVPSRPSRVSEASLVDRIAIDAVEVDKTEVCRGEQVTVTVRARSLDHREHFLSYGIVGKPELVGPRVTFELEESLGYDWMKVFLRGKHATVVSASVPPVLVKPCDAAPLIRIGLERRAEVPDRAWLRAEVVTSGAEPFQAVEYEWDFGDGSIGKDAAPEVEHSYEHRAQTQAYSYFFVTAKARDASGRVATGSRSLRFVNLGFLPLLNEERVLIFSGVRPEPTADDPRSEAIWLYHGAPFPVTLEQVAVKEVAIEAGGAERTLSTRRYDASALLGVTELAPGKSTAIRDLGALRPTEPGALRVVELSGRGPGSKRAEGSFTLLARDGAAHGASTSL